MKYREWLKFCVNYVFAAFICVYKHLISVGEERTNRWHK